MVGGRGHRAGEREVLPGKSQLGELAKEQCKQASAPMAKRSLSPNESPAWRVTRKQRYLRLGTHTSTPEIANRIAGSEAVGIKELDG